MAKRVVLDPSARPMSSLGAVVKYPDGEVVANLTNPKNHYEPSSRCINDGKHPCAEKPLGMRLHGHDADVVSKRVLGPIRSVQN
jgi:predicted dehydrogenase